MTATFCDTDSVRDLAFCLRRTMDFVDDVGGIECAIIWLELLREYEQASEESATPPTAAANGSRVPWPHRAT